MTYKKADSSESAFLFRQMASNSVLLNYLE